MDELNKYRLLLAYGKDSKYVAARTPEEAATACFPGVQFHETGSGTGWVRYKSEQELPESWPQEETGGGGGNVLDVECLGTISVVRDDG